MENDEFRERIFDLQKCSVMDLCPSMKVQQWIKEGLVKDLEDWKQMHIHARDFLGHTCSPRCQIRVGEGEGKENFRCKKINTVFAGKIHLSMSLFHCNMHSLKNSMIS